jgi:hypothetical protein
MIRPIPKKRLPNSVTYKPYTTDTGEGSSYGTSITLSNVKVEERKQLFQTKDGNEIIGNALMFYDLINSSGLTDVPTNHSEIIFSGRTYHIIDTEILRDDRNTPHHYEVMLK